MKYFIALSLIMASATIVHADKVEIFSPLEFILPEQKPQPQAFHMYALESFTKQRTLNKKFHSNCEIVEDGKTHKIIFEKKGVNLKEYRAGGLTIDFKLHKGEINLDIKGKNIEPQLLEESFGHKVYKVGKMKVTCDTKSPIERMYALLDPKANQAFTEFVQHNPSYLTSKTVGAREQQAYGNRIKEILEQTR